MGRRVGLKADPQDARTSRVSWVGLQADGLSRFG
jgi:hypothetical protein